MPVRLEFVPEVIHEIEQALDWYESQRPGLGADFAAELDRALTTIATQPRASPLWPEALAQALGVHRFVMSRFPFAIPFVVREDLVVVLALAHVRRLPGYWLNRTGAR